MSEDDKSFKFKFQPDAIKDWKIFAVQNLNLSNELIRQHLCDKMIISTLVLHELQKLSVNATIFSDYLEELEGVYLVTEEGSIELAEEDIANVWKCLLTLAESKKLLSAASLSLELH